MDEAAPFCSASTARQFCFGLFFSYFLGCRMPRGQEGKQDGKGCFGKVLMRKRSDHGGDFVVASKERLGHRVSLAST